LSGIVVQDVTDLRAVRELRQVRRQAVVCHVRNITVYRGNAERMVSYSRNDEKRRAQWSDI
jgi:hypothetical protein